MGYLVLIFWLVAVTAQIAIAVALYHMAERRFGSGTLWGAIGFCFGWLGLLAFAAFLIFDESRQTARDLEESQRIERFMQEYGELRHDEQQAQQPAVAPERRLKDLIAAGQLRAATELAREQLRRAHEHGNTRMEELYRGYLRELEEQHGE